MTRQYVGLRVSTDPEAVPTTDHMGEGELAINVASGRIYVRFGSDIRDITDRYTRSEIDEMLGSAAVLNVPEEGDAAENQVVLGNDSRLSDARAPTAHQHAWQQITDKPSAYPPSEHGHTWDQITGKPTEYPAAPHGHGWPEISGAPATATRWPAFSEVSDKPSTYPPSPHGHPISEITEAGTAAQHDAADFDSAGSAAQALDTARREAAARPDPLLMHFL
jgi:hypothetical protein